MWNVWKGDEAHLCFRGRSLAISQSIPRICNVGNAENVDAKENVFYCILANEGSADESSNFGPDGFDKLHERATWRAWGSKSPASKVKDSPTTSPRAVLALDRKISATP
jgi:hypothetical protein